MLTCNLSDTHEMQCPTRTLFYSVRLSQLVQTEGLEFVQVAEQKIVIKGNLISTVSQTVPGFQGTLKRVFVGSHFAPASYRCGHSNVIYSHCLRSLPNGSE